MIEKRDSFAWGEGGGGVVARSCQLEYVHCWQLYSNGHALVNWNMCTAGNYTAMGTLLSTGICALLAIIQQ